MSYKRILSIILVLIAILGTHSFPTVAYKTVESVESTIQDNRLNYIFNTRQNFFISEEHEAIINAIVNGVSNLSTGGVIEIKLQHRFLFWWFDVNGGSWIDEYDGIIGISNHSLYLSTAGEYRVVFNYKVYGNDGGFEEQSATIYDTY